MTTTTANKPEKTLRIGAISAAVWKNTSTDGKPFYSVSFERTYRNEEGFKRSDGFNHGDLLSVAKLAERAEAYISERLAA